MNAASVVLTVACVLAAAGAAVLLWRGASGRIGPARPAGAGGPAPSGGPAGPAGHDGSGGPDRKVRRDGRGYRWLAVAAACWGAGLAARQAWGVPAGSTAIPLTFADLPSLLAPAAAAAGLAVLAQSGQARRDPAGGLAARLADGYLLAAALSLIGWVTVLGPRYDASAVAPAGFALHLIHPLLDSLALGAVLPLAVTAGRRVALPCLALLVVAVSDVLDVGARLAGGHAGVASQLLLVAALCLLAAAPAAEARWPAPQAGAGEGRQLPRLLTALAGLPARGLPPRGWPARGLPAGGWPASRTGRVSGSPEPPQGQAGTAAGAGGSLAARAAGDPAAAALAALAALAAAAAVIGSVLAGGPPSGPVVQLAAGTAVLALAGRAFGLARRQRASALSGQEPGASFRDLADRISDAVLVCDLGGVIGYASPAVAGYGYLPGSLAGRHLGDFLHPEDRAGGARAVRAAAGDPERRTGRYPCRVRAADGTWRHVEAMFWRQPGPAGADQLLITARDLSDQVALRRQVAHLTFHDGLTGLPNRAYLEDRARDALGAASGAGAGVIVLDLDGFTAVNDSAGRSAGDLILAQAARRLRAAVPPRDTVARWGGDEFAVLIEGSVTAREVIDTAERLAASISAEPFRAGDRELPMRASLGVMVADGSPPGYLWRNADLALARAKQAGGGRVEVHAPESGTDGTGGVEMARDLQRAIAAAERGRSGGQGAGLPGAALPRGLRSPGTPRTPMAADPDGPDPDGPGSLWPQDPRAARGGGGLSLAYQPVVELATGRVRTAGVLVRWHRGDREVPAAELLGLAEASGLSVPLGEWVIREACAQAGEWYRAGLTVGVSVPVTGAQAAAPRFADSVARALSGSGLPASSLTLEAAGRDLIQGGEVLPGLAELRQSGVRLAIADFGPGEASLSRLRRRPADVVKIGPAFVAGLGADGELTEQVAEIVRAGRDLGTEVVAAGVEQPSQLALLREMGCPLAQGSAVAPVAVAAAVAAAAAGEPAAPDPDRTAVPAPASVPDAETKLLPG